LLQRDVLTPQGDGSGNVWDFGANVALAEVGRRDGDTEGRGVGEPTRAFPCKGYRRLESW
jgi:hypothetical protein